MIVETHFQVTFPGEIYLNSQLNLLLQMNYNTGEWKRIKKYRRLEDVIQWSKCDKIDCSKVFNSPSIYLICCYLYISSVYYLKNCFLEYINVTKTKNQLVLSFSSLKSHCLSDIYKAILRGVLDILNFLSMLLVFHSTEARINTALLPQHYPLSEGCHSWPMD